VKQASNNRISYTSLSDATPETELDALVWAYKFILERHKSKKAADPTGDPNEAKEGKNLDPERTISQ
jgi:hypothetical protein